MNALLLDLRQALRGLNKRRGFTVVAVLTLSLAIAATTTVVAVVDATIIRPLPFPDAGRLVNVVMTTPEGADFSASEPDYLDFAHDNRTFSSLAAFKPADATVVTNNEPRRVHAVAASQSFFATLGERPLLGRAFTVDEDLPRTTSNVVLLSNDLWRTRFGADSSIVGKTVLFDGVATQVIGVMRPGFHFPQADAFVPLHAGTSTDRGDHWLSLVGRLRSGTSIAVAAADIARIARNIAGTTPASKGWSARLEALSHSIVDDTFRRAGWVMLAATGLLLLLACANVANLLLARGTERQAEMGVRAALGAGRSRLIRLCLTESAIIVAAATALGIAAAEWAEQAIHAIGANGIPRLEQVAIDGRIIAIAVAMSVVTTFVCGIFPALRAASIDPAATLGDGVRAGVSRRTRRVRDGLVVLQVATSLMLLIGAGLLLRSFDKLSTVDAGFDAEHVLAVNLQLPLQKYDEERQAIFFVRLAARVQAVPGVRAVGATSVDPLSGWNLMNDVTPEERAAATSAAGFMQAAWRSVTPDYFAAMGIATLRGRVFSADDAYNGPRLAVVSRSFAEKMWPNEDPVGKRFYWGGTTGRTRTVIGVVNDVRDVAPQTVPVPTLYLANNQVPMPGMTVVVRIAGAPLALANSLRDAVHSLDPLLSVEDIHPLRRNRVDALTGARFNLTLMAVFAALALVLAASGLYAVVAFGVVQRRREIGIRLALGAQPSAVVGFFLRSGARLIGLGTVVGLAGALLAAKFMAGLLYGVVPDDAVTFASVTVVLVVVALVASYVPARRASHVMPTEVLRAD
ncbi:MAG: ABC transporter permease [Gemmatimonadales bacterium]